MEVRLPKPKPEPTPDERILRIDDAVPALEARATRLLRVALMVFLVTVLLTAAVMVYFWTQHDAVFIGPGGMFLLGIGAGIVILRMGWAARHESESLQLQRRRLLREMTPGVPPKPEVPKKLKPKI